MYNKFPKKYKEKSLTEFLQEAKREDDLKKAQAKQKRKYVPKKKLKDVTNLQSKWHVLGDILHLPCLIRMDVLNHSVAKVLNLYYFLGNRELAAILTPAVRKPIPDFKVRSMHEEMKVGFCWISRRKIKKRIVHMCTCRCLQETPFTSKLYYRWNMISLFGVLTKKTLRSWNEVMKICSRTTIHKPIGWMTPIGWTILKLWYRIHSRQRSGGSTRNMICQRPTKQVGFKVQFRLKGRLYLTYFIYLTYLDMYLLKTWECFERNVIVLSGCARTEGYYKISHQAKSYLRAQRQVGDERGDVDGMVSCE